MQHFINTNIIFVALALLLPDIYFTLRYGVASIIRWLLVVIIFASGCKKMVSPRVKYFVDGTSPTYSVLYKDAIGTDIILDTVPYNWSVSFESRKDAPLMLSATAHNDNSWAKVYIYIDGKLLESEYKFGDKETARVETILKLIF